MPIVIQLSNHKQLNNNQHFTLTVISNQLSNWFLQVIAISMLVIGKYYTQMFKQTCRRQVTMKILIKKAKTVLV